MRLVVFALVLAAPVLAQPVTPEVACTYTDCAIRLETSFFGGERIVTGLPGQEVRLGSVGLLGGGLVDAVEQAPLALEHAERARSQSVYGLVTVAVGTVAMFYAVSAGLDGDPDRDPNGTDLGIYIGGAALTTVGAVLTISARKERVRAVWEYNRAVAGE